MPTKVAYLIRPAAGGMRNHLTGLLSTIDRKRFDPFVIGSISDDLEKLLNSQEVDFFKIDMADRVSPARDIRTLAETVSILKKTKPQLVHIHGNKAASLGIPAAYLAGKLKTIVTVHNFLSESSRLAIWSKVLGKAHRIIAVSEAIKRELVDVAKIPLEKIKVIHNGLDMSSWRLPVNKSLRDTYSIPDGNPLIGTLGRMVPWKGFSIFVEAIAGILPELPNALAIIAGDGPMLEELKNKVQELGLSDRVIFTGLIPDPRTFFAGIDLFVFPSLREPFGIALLEAMASETPIIASASEGVLEIVDESCAVIVEPGNQSQIAAAIQRLSADSSFANTLVEKALARVKKSFSLNEMGERTQEIYDSVVNAN